MKIRRISAEATWPLRHAAMWPDHPVEFVQLENDAAGIHYGLYQDDLLISVVSFFRQGKSLQFRKFATLPRFQGKGYGSKLLYFALEEQCQSSVKMVWCNARIDKKSYYSRFGLQPTDQHFTKGGIDFIIMKKELSGNE